MLPSQGNKSWGANKNGKSSTIYQATYHYNNEYLEIAFSFQNLTMVEFLNFSIGIVVAKNDAYIITGAPRFI